MLRKNETCRIYPGDWLSPSDFKGAFADPTLPLDIDVGCGKGRFLLARAANQSDRNLLGIDRMLRRIRRLNKKVVRKNLHNVRLMRLDAYYAISYLIPKKAVSTYFIFFPDPWPKKKHHKYRLMNPPFVEALHRTLVDKGEFHFATDHLPYFEDAMKILTADERFKQIETRRPSEEERTDFELYYINSKDIGRASFQKT